MKINLRHLILCLLLTSLQWQTIAQASFLATPYECIDNHYSNLQSDNYRPDLAARSFNVSPGEGRKLAIRLKQILDGRGLYVNMGTLPDRNDFRDTLTNDYTYRPFPLDLPEVILKRVNGSWYYSDRTVAQIPKLHKRTFPFGLNRLLDNIPEWAVQKFFGLTIWQYMGILVLGLFLFLLHFLLTKILNVLVKRFGKLALHVPFLNEMKVKSISKYLSILIILAISEFFLPALQLPAPASKFLIVAVRVINTILVVFVILRILEILLEYATSFADKTDTKLDDQFLPILERILQSLAVIGGIYYILLQFHVDVSAIIAGIGILGLAMALAAQDTVRNLIGSATIFIDRPFQIGDWIIGDGFAGIVDEVGFRTTRIRKPDSSIISVPNGDIVNMEIRNLGVRSHRLIDATLGITYDTPPDLIEKFLEGLDLIALYHPKTANQGYYIYFNAFSASSLDIFFRVPILVNSYVDELQVKEEIYLSIIRLAEKLGVRFAFPSTTVYVEEFPGNGSTVPPYESAKPHVNGKVNDFITEYRNWVNNESAKRMNNTYGMRHQDVAQETDN